MSDIQSAVNSFKLSFFKNNRTQNNNKVTEKLFAKYKLKSEDEQQKESQVDTSTIGLTLKDAVDSIFDPTTGMSDEEKKKFIDKLYKKIKSGKKLSADEMQYLRMNDPVTYAKMAKVQIQRKALESRLKQAKSKEEALEIYTSAKSRISDDDPAREELNAAYDDAYGEFKKSEQYKKLPATEKEKSVKKSETKKTDPKKEVDLWLNHFAYQTINRFIMEADASGCDFLQVNTSGKVEGYGEEDGELKKMYEDTIERLPDSKFFPYVCSEFERLWREVSTDYSDDKFVIQWK